MREPAQVTFEPKFRLASHADDELYLFPVEPHYIAEIVAQDNPAYAKIDLPHLQTTVHVCLPASRVVRVYDSSISLNSLVGEWSAAGHHANTRVRYRFGIRLLPWMFQAHLTPPKQQRFKKRDLELNYVIPNSTGGYAGVVIRAIRRTNQAQQRLKIYSFDCETEQKFSAWREHARTKLIATFEPAHLGTHDEHWRPVATA